MCTLYHQSKGQSVQNDSHTSNNKIQATTSNINCNSVPKDLDPQDTILGQVWIGDPRKVICIPANLVKVIEGKTSKEARRLSCMIEARSQNNLPLGVVVNRTAVTPSKSNKVPVTLVNTNSYNVWIRQQLLAADIVEVDHCPWDYHSIMSRDANNVQVLFQPVPTLDVQADIFSVNSTQTEEKAGDRNSTEGIEQEERPKFGPRPKFNSKKFDFDKELARLPFPVNFGEVELSPSQQKRFLELVYDHQGVFSLCDEDLGLCDRLKHTIPTMTTKPVYLPHRTIPVQLQTEVHKCLDTWLKQGIIRPSRSPYASQVVIVRKKTGEIRLCIDFRALNAVTVRDSFPLPRIEEALQAVKSAMCFTSIDLAQGYLQLAMDEADIHKTAFRAGSSGLYEFTRMPFRLSNAGASFCRLMEMCLGDQQYLTLLFYLDDICIFSSSVDEMLNRVEMVLERLQDFNLKIKPKKSFFFQSKVLFLGHILSKDGISPNPDKIQKVKDWPVPTNAKEVHSFLGLASYYRRFVPQFAKWANPLHDLIRPVATKKSRPRIRLPPLQQNLPKFDWTELHNDSFEKLKLALTSAPILAYPNYSKPFLLETDASLKGLGAVLSQEDDDGKMRVISYASRTLKPYEKSMQNYSSAKLELLALKWSVCEKFRDYLIGSKFTVLTDNNPLTYVRTSRLGASQIRWLSDLALFDFDIKYRAGKSNQAADALSRRPANPDSTSESSDDEEEWEAISYQMVSQILDNCLDSTKIPCKIKHEVQVSTADVCEANSSIGIRTPSVVDIQLNQVKLFHSISPSKMAELQKRCNQLSVVYEYVANNIKPKLSEIHRIRSKPIRRLLLQYDRLSLIWGVLHRRTFMDDDEIQQLVLPLSLRNSVLQSLHDDNGHQGAQRVTELLRSKVYWPTMFVDTDHWLAQCEQCHIAKGDYTEPRTQQGTLTANQPLELLCIDFTKADPSKGGKENILILTDAFSKYSQAFVTTSQKANIVAKLLVEKWFNVFGVPARIHSDQGRSFDNEIISHLCKMYGIRQSTTMPYNPRGNTICERFNRTLFGLMRTLTKEQKPNWPTYVPSLVYAYNSTPHSSTGFQPYELMFGRKAPTPCDDWLGLSHYKSDSFKTKTVWLKQQLDAMMFANKQALKYIKKSNKRNQSQISGKELVIPIGNHVLLRSHPEGRNKIQDKFKSDVYYVSDHHKEPNVYYIKWLGADKYTPPKVVNRRQLFDLKRSVPPSANSRDGFASVPSYLHHNRDFGYSSDDDSNLDCSTDFDSAKGTATHHYNTRAKRKAAAPVRPVAAETTITCL